MLQSAASRPSQFVISVEDKQMVPHLKKVLKQMQGVTIETLRKSRPRKSGLEQAIRDVEKGDVTCWDCSTEDMLKSILQG